MYLKMLFSMTSQTEDILWHNCSWQVRQLLLK